MSGLFQDLRYALRQLRKNPGYTLVAVLTLSLGIGSTTAIYSVVYATFLEPMPYPHPEQLVMVWSRVSDGRSVVSTGDFLDWKRQNSAFQDLNAWTDANFNLATSDRPEEVPGHLTTPGWFTMQGFRFFLGRDFVSEEGETGKDHVVILMHNLWERLGADRNIIGRQIRMNGELYSVVGVLAPGVADRLPVQVTAPLAFKPDQMDHKFRWLTVMGRLKPGVSMAQAQADMDVVTRRIAQDHPDSNKNWGASVEPLRNNFIPRQTLSTLWLLMGAVGLVLLIACTNVANLLLARGTTRQREIAVRASMGASRRKLFTQFLVESLVLAIMGAAVGIGVGQAILKALITIMPPSTLPSEADIQISLPTLYFTLIATMAAAILFGCAPAWQASRVNPNEALKEGGRAGNGAGRHQLRRTLVVVEFALALTLFVTGVYGKSLPNQNGAPMRLITPWKYGFKGIKSIVTVRFTDTQPVSSWMEAWPQAYGFYANVNPNVDHPRWSQVREDRLGESKLSIFGGGGKRATLMFNGYTEQVAHMYAGMDLRKNY